MFNSPEDVDIVACLHQRAKDICSNQSLLKHEETTLVESMKRNGYPLRVIKATMMDKPKEDHVKPNHTTSIVNPHYKGLLGKIQRI